MAIAVLCAICRRHSINNWRWWLQSFRCQLLLLLQLQLSPTDAALSSGRASDVRLISFIFHPADLRHNRLFVPNQNWTFSQIPESDHIQPLCAKQYRIFRIKSSSKLFVSKNRCKTCNLDLFKPLMPQEGYVWHFKVKLDWKATALCDFGIRLFLREYFSFLPIFRAVYDGGHSLNSNGLVQLSYDILIVFCASK